MKKLLSSLLMVFVCSSAFGATQLKKTVCLNGQNAGGNCDYTSLESCMNTNEQNLVTADKYFDVEILGEWATADTTAVTIHNYTTDATRYINIYTTGSARHAGYKTANKYVLHTTDSNSQSRPFQINRVAYTIVDGLIIKGTNTGGTFQAIVYLEGSNDKEYRFVFINNIILGDGTSTTTEIDGVRLDGLYNTARFYNNIIYGVNRVNGAGIRTISTAYAYIQNNTVYGNTNVGISCGSTNTLIQNNISYNNGTDYSGSCSGSSSNNISKDTTAPGTSGDSKTITFNNVSAGSENLHLISTDTDAIDQGTTITSPVAYTTDIDGQTRTGTWDIGADEYQVTAATGGPSILRNSIIRNSIIR